jgi:hypothetical protein
MSVRRLHDRLHDRLRAASIGLALAGTWGCGGEPARVDQPDTSSPAASLSAVGAPAAPAAPPGVVVFRFPDGVGRVEAREGAVAEKLGPRLDRLSPGRDEWATISRDGTHLALGTTRFGCADWACVAIVPADLSRGDAIRAGGALVHSDGTAAIGEGGRLVVFAAATDKPKIRDLFVTRRDGEAWSAPVKITGASKHPYNKQPELSFDGKTVAFDCGPEPYGQELTAACTVGIDGSGLREVWSPGKAPLGDSGAVHHPAWEPDGSLLLEIQRASDGERIYRMRPGKEPEPMGKWTNDNSPCALPDGSIASMWLNRPENRRGLHELKIMSPDGATGFGLVIGIDLVDTGTSCGKKAY